MSDNGSKLDYIFVAVPHTALLSDAFSNLSEKAKVVYLKMWLFAGKNREVWPSAKTLAKLAGCDKSTVGRARKSIVAEGLAELIRPGGAQATNKYRLLIPPLTPEIEEKLRLSGQEGLIDPIRKREAQRADQAPSTPVEGANATALEHQPCPDDVGKTHNASVDVEESHSPLLISSTSTSTPPPQVRDDTRAQSYAEGRTHDSDNGGDGIAVRHEQERPESELETKNKSTSTLTAAPNGPAPAPSAPGALGAPSLDSSSISVATEGDVPHREPLGSRGADRPTSAHGQSATQDLGSTAGPPRTNAQAKPWELPPLTAEQRETVERDSNAHLEYLWKGPGALGADDDTFDRLPRLPTDWMHPRAESWYHVDENPTHTQLAALASWVIAWMRRENGLKVRIEENLGPEVGQVKRLQEQLGDQLVSYLVGLGYYHGILMEEHPGVELYKRPSTSLLKPDLFTQAQVLEMMSTPDAPCLKPSAPQVSDPVDDQEPAEQPEANSTDDEDHDGQVDALLAVWRDACSTHNPDCQLDDAALREAVETAMRHADTRTIEGRMEQLARRWNPVIWMAEDLCEPSEDEVPTEPIRARLFDHPAIVAALDFVSDGAVIWRPQIDPHLAELTPGDIATDPETAEEAVLQITDFWFIETRRQLAILGKSREAADIREIRDEVRSCLREHGTAATIGRMKILLRRRPEVLPRARRMAGSGTSPGLDERFVNAGISRALADLYWIENIDNWRLTDKGKEIVAEWDRERECIDD